VQSSLLNAPTQTLADVSPHGARGSQEGCAMLFLPECFSFIGTNLFDALEVAEPLDGPIMDRYRELARSHGLWLSLGGFQVR
jgi:hypothetical protein